MHAFVFDPLWEKLINQSHRDLLEQANVIVHISTQIAPLHECTSLYSGDEPRILALNPDYVNWALPSEVYQNIPNLTAVITESTSYGWIDLAAANSNKIPVVNIKNFSTQSVAEWAVMMMLNLARKTPLLIKANFPLNYGTDFETYQGFELKGKRVGIVGLGNIGQAIAERCHGLGMEVFYWSHSAKDVPYKRCELNDIFSLSDVIFPAMADSAETHHVITDAHINLIKKQAIFVSIVHKYYNHTMLLQKVREGNLFGYGFEAEKPNTFENFEGNVWAAPAYAWCTTESLVNSMNLFVQAITDAARGHYPNQVNTGF